MILKSQFTRTSKCWSWCQNTSWGQTVRHYFKEFAMTSTRRHRVKKFVIASKDLSWCQKICQKICHDVKQYAKSLSWNQKYVMMSKSLNVLSSYLHTLTYNLICYILIKCYIVLQLYRINLRINYNIVIVCKILVQNRSIYSIKLLLDQTKCINIIN